MNMTTKLLVFFCILFSMGYVTLAQNDTSSNKITITTGNVRIIVDKHLADDLPVDFFSGLKTAPKFNRRTKMGYDFPAQDSVFDGNGIISLDGISFIDFEVLWEYLFKKSGIDPNKSGRPLSKEEQQQLGIENKEHLTSSQIGNYQYQPGDYTQLLYSIRMNRPGKYKLGEPIFICRYVKNTSDSNVFIRTPPQTFQFSADKVTLVDAEGNDVSMTCAGNKEEEWIANVKNNRNISIYPVGSGARFVQPQAEARLGNNPIVLNHYFDLTQPGIYHLTFYRVTFCNAQEYDEPLASNTLTFEVLDEFVTPEDLKDPGEFNWPPRDAPGKTPASSTPDVAKPPAE